MTLAFPPVAITGIGLATSLGVSAVHACAAARAGISRESPLELDALNPDTGQGEPIMGHAIRGATDGFVGIGRLWRLAALAIQDLVRTSGVRVSDGSECCLWLHVSHGYYDLVLNASDPSVPVTGLRDQLPDELSQERGLFEQRALTDLLPGLGTQLGIPPAQQFLSFGSSATFLAALAQAQDVTRNRGLKRCIAAAVDSLVDPRSLAVLARLGMLKTGDNPTGMAPGEAAAFILMDARPEAQSKGHLELESVEYRVGTTHRFSNPPSNGEALADILAAHGPGVLPATIGDLNGDPQRSAPFGEALVRLRTKGGSFHTDHWFPAQSFGDTGSAAAAVGICVAAHALTRGYSGYEKILVWSNADDGTSASCVIRVRNSTPQRAL